MVQHPPLVRPQLRPLPEYGFPQTLQNCYLKFLVYCLTTWNEFVVDYTLPVKENHQHHLQVGWTDSSFLRSGRSLPHPLWRLSLGFDVIAINPGFVVMMVIKKFSLTLTRSSSSRLMLTRFAFWSWILRRRDTCWVFLSELLGMIQSWCVHLQQSLW